jgi:hypothetical protein
MWPASLPGRLDSDPFSRRSTRILPRPERSMALAGGRTTELHRGMNGLRGKPLGGPRSAETRISISRSSGRCYADGADGTGRMGRMKAERRHGKGNGPGMRRPPGGSSLQSLAVGSSSAVIRSIRPIRIPKRPARPRIERCGTVPVSGARPAHGASAKSASAQSASGLLRLSPGMRRPRVSGTRPNTD